MIKSEMLILLKLELREVAATYTDDELNAAIDNGTRETGFALPTSEDFRIFWIKERSKRAVFYLCLIDNAPKVRYEQIYLQQKYEHYKRMIDDMDKAFAKAVKDNAIEFSGVTDIYKMFGSNISAGFAYSEITGEDTTFCDWNKVYVQPN